MKRPSAFVLSWEARPWHTVRQARMRQDQCTALYQVLHADQHVVAQTYAQWKADLEAGYNN